jgi:hypothetical protein
MPGNGQKVIAAVRAKAALGARQRRLRRDLSAHKASAAATVRVTSEAAKANHRKGLKPASGLFPCGNRATTGTGRELRPDG